MVKLDRIITMIKKRRAVIVALAAAIVFATTYALILPAVTLDQETAEKQGGVDVPAVEEITTEESSNEADLQRQESSEDQSTEESSDAVSAGEELTFEGKGYTAAAAFGKDAELPENTDLEVEELTADDEDYEAWCDEALKAVQEAKGGDQVAGLEFAKFYDITLTADGEQVEPSAPVDVTISYNKSLKAKDADHLRVIHFVADEDGNLEPEVLKAKDVDATIKKGKMSETAFKAASFSMYAVVYTVDFEYTDEESGEVYQYSIEGGSSIKLSALFKALGVKAKLEDVEDVTFSDPKLVKVSKNMLGDDWTLKSLKAFDTNETLTVKMAGGEEIVVKVTDEAYTDITPLLKTVDIKGATQEGGNYTVYPGKPYTVELKFEETPEDTFNRTGSVTYQLPNGVLISEPQSGTIVPSDSSQAEIYSINYTIGTDGRVTFTWDVKPGKEEDFAKLPGMFIGLDIEAEFDENVSKINWNGKAQVTVDDTHDVGVKKSAYLGDDGYMYYTVTVTSTGTNKNISLTDTISGTALTLDQGSITETTGHGATFSNLTDKGFNISIPELKPGETAEIKYRAAVDYDVLAAEAGVEKGKYGTAATTGNQIKINGTDDNPDNDEDETHSDHNINISSAGKKVAEGSYDESTGKRTMKWQITANNEHKTKISYIHDAMGQGKEKMSYSGEGITVKVVNPDWSEAASFIVPWSQLGVNENSKEWTYTIPDQYKDKNYSFIIDYSTEVDVTDSIVPETVSNGVDTDYGTGSTSGKAEPSPESKLDMEKSVVESDIPGGTVTWKITVDVPANGLDSCVVTDTLPTVSGPENFTDGFDSSSFDKAHDVTGLIDGEDVELDTSQSGKVIFTFTKGGESGLYPVEGGREVTITLTTTLDEDWMAFEITEDYLSYYNTHTNNAKLVANSYTIEDSASVTVNSTAPSMIKKADSYLKDNFHWKEYGDENNLKAWMYRLYLYGISDDTFKDGYLEITDTFDDRYLAYYDPNNTDVFTNNGNIDLYHQKLTHGCNNGNYNDPVDIEATVSGGTITFRIPQSAFLNESGGYDRFYHVSYFLHVKDKDTIQKMDEDALAAGGTLKLKNTAVWAYSEPTEVEVEHKIPIIDKNYDATDEEKAKGTYHFTIKVNEGGDQLGDAEFLEVTDSYTNLSIDYATLECEPEDALLSYTHTGNTVTYYVKNGVPVTLNYTAHALENGPFSNTVEVNGQSVTKTGTADITSRGTTGAREASIKILKHSGKNLLEGIEGVQFELYEYDESFTNNYDPSKKVLGGTYSTDTNGMFTIKHIPIKAEGGVYTTHTGKYVLHEVEPPEGYKALAHDYVFTVDTQTANYGQYIYMHDDTLPISNEPEQEEELSIKVNKIWPDGDADLPDLIRVHLYQKESKTASAASAIEIDSAEITRDKDGTWSHTFTGLEAGKAYFVREDPVDGYKVTYSSNNTLGLERSGEISITNTKTEPDDETTSIVVQKKWKNGENEITDVEQKKDLTATVELVRYRTEQTGTTVHFVNAGSSDEITSLLLPRNTSGVVVNVDSISGGNDTCYMTSYDPTIADYSLQSDSSISTNSLNANSARSLTINTPDVSDIWVVNRYGAITELTVSTDATISGGGDPVIDPDYTSAATVTLSRGNGWRDSFKDLPTTGNGSDGKPYVYSYGVRETATSDPAFELESYSVETSTAENANGATVPVDSGSTVTVTNKKEVHTGNLEITKNIQKNGTLNSSGTGTFYYAVYHESKVENGVPKSGAVADRTGSIVIGSEENGTKKVTEENLEYGTYYVFELTAENGQPIISGTDGAVQKIGSTVYKVTESGTSAEVGGNPGQITLNNSEETIKAKVRKVWADDNNKKAKRPDSLTVELYAHSTHSGEGETGTADASSEDAANGDSSSAGTSIETVTLNESNEWTSEVVENLPLYDEEGNTISYHWVEGAMPNGYFLTEISTETVEGVVTTTLTNTLNTYDLKTSYVGVKTWEDNNNGWNTRPSVLTIKLYQIRKTNGEYPEKGTEVTGVTPEWNYNYQTNQWQYAFDNLPVFDDNGEIIKYYTEETAPGGYTLKSGTGTPVDTTWQLGTAHAEKITPDNQIQWNLGSLIDLSFMIIKTTDQDFVIWTHRVPTPNELNQINAEGLRLFGDFKNKNKNKIYVSGIGTINTSKGTIVITYDASQANPMVTLRFSGPRVWSQYAKGQFTNTQYNAGTTNYTNTLDTTELSGTKTWEIGGEAPDNATAITLKLTRTTANSAVPEAAATSETIYAKSANEKTVYSPTATDQFLQPVWNGNTYKFENLPAKDANGKAYTYHVAEWNFTVNGCTYSVDVSGNVTKSVSSAPDMKVTYVAGTGGAVNITNTETKDFEFSKVWKNTVDETVTWPDGKTITVTLNASAGSTAKALADTELTFSPSSVPQGWTVTTSADGKKTTFKTSGLQAKKNGVELEYYITETPVDGYKAPSYADAAGDPLVYADKALDEQQVINAPEAGVELPSTGGPGTTWIYLLGLILFIGCSVTLIARRRVRS